MTKKSRKQKIFEAVEKIYGGSNQVVLTVTDICREASISRKTFYQYFDNLKALLVSYVEYVSAEMFDSRDSADMEENSWLQLQKLLERINYISAKYRLFKTLLKSSLIESGDRYITIALADSFTAKLREKITEIIDDGIKKGQFKMEAKDYALILTIDVGIIYFLLDDDYVEGFTVEQIKNNFKSFISSVLKPVGYRFEII